MSLYIGDVRDGLRSFIAAGVRAQTCVTSPPYWGLRDYGVAGQLGLEPTITEYVANMVEVFRLVRDVLADDGTLWLNLGDSYASGGRGGGMDGPAGEKQRSNEGALLGPKRPTDGLKPKDICGIPWRIAFALQADGWWLRQDIIWSKPNPMPESVTDRCTKSHEYLFLLAKSERYYYNAAAIQEPAAWPKGAGNVVSQGAPGFEIREGLHKVCPREIRNKRSVWTLATQPFAEAHFATFPTALVEPCIMAGASMRVCNHCGASRRRDSSGSHCIGCGSDIRTPGATRPGLVLDPFMGSGTVAQVAQDLGRQWRGCELNPEYAKLVAKRTAQHGLILAAAER